MAVVILEVAAVAEVEAAVVVVVATTVAAVVSVHRQLSEVQIGKAYQDPGCTLPRQLLLRTLDRDARHSNESCCPPQSLRVTKKLVPRVGVLWPCFSPDNTMEWTVLEQVLASHWGCVTRTAIHLATLELTVHTSNSPPP